VRRKHGARVLCMWRHDAFISCDGDSHRRASVSVAARSGGRHRTAPR
jgi:hypothetical protein